MDDLSEQAFADLMDYLLDHEADIAHKANDFGDLAGVFEEILNRPPEK